jgi:hypothetical protein
MPQQATSDSVVTIAKSLPESPPAVPQWDGFPAIAVDRLRDHPPIDNELLDLVPDIARRWFPSLDQAKA